jgi:Alpha-tubulin suppressor and related RCC1 domain-containing proteins
MKKRFALPLAVASAVFGFTYSTPMYYTLFGSKKSDNKEAKIQQTKTYIWGNGVYQPRPDAAMRFKNFEPKLIKSFLGPNNLNMIDIAFGEHCEGGITTNKEVYIWQKHVMDASFSENDDIRKDPILLDKSKNNKQLTFSKGFAWVLKENGEVYQYPIHTEIDEDSGKIKEIKVAKAPRKIEELKDVVQICTGADHFVALDKNGDVWTMGDDTMGILNI